MSLPCNADRKTLRPVVEAKVLGSVERRSIDEAIIVGGVNDARERKEKRWAGRGVEECG